MALDGSLARQRMADKKDESNPDLDALAGGWQAPWEEGDPKSDEPDMAKLDEGWLDELFPEDDEPEEEEEEEEPLPDERLDPVAYAAAKKAREERAVARQKKKKAKLEAKRARQRARAAEAKQKQKQKQKPKKDKSKERERAKAKAKDAREAKRSSSLRESDAEIEPVTSDDGDEDAPVAKKKSSPKKGEPLARSAQWKLLAIVVVVFLAAAAFAAAMAR